MKNLFFTVAAVVALTITLASCKKDRTCTCTSTSGTVTKSEIKKVSKKTVRDEYDCVSYVNTYTEDGDVDVYGETCELD